MKNLKQQNIKFFNKIAHSYDSFPFKQWSIKTQKKVISLSNIKENSKILDAGFGTGNLLFLLSKQNKNLELNGINISPEMLKIAKKKLKNKAILKLQLAEKINYRNKFNFIFSVDAFHHYSNHKKVLENFYRALKKKGKLIIVDLDFGKFLNWLFHNLEPGNSKMYLHKEIKELLGNAGFRNIKQKKIGWFSWMILGEK